MRRFLLGLFTAIMTLAVVLGAGLLLAKLEPKEEPVPAVTEETLPPETEAVPETTLPQETTEPVEKVIFNVVPRHYQTDYPYIKFGNGTIATSGCSITCLSMIATYMTDQEYLPPQMAYHFGRYGKNNIARLDYGLSEMQLPYYRTSNVMEVLQLVKEGKVAIVMMDEESVFTTEQHFIVIAGMTEDGKYIVHDPMETNYLNADVAVKNCYDNGFDDFYLMRGFSGGWVFDKTEMTEDSFRFDASMPEQKENRYEGYTLTGEDIYMLACFVWAEAGNEPPIVQQAVAEVALNRLVSDAYPDTVHDVLYQTEFYRSAKIMYQWGEKNNDPYIAVDAAMYGPYVLPEDILFYSAWEKGEEEWGQLGSYTFYKKR